MRTALALICALSLVITDAREGVRALGQDADATPPAISCQAPSATPSPTPEATAPASMRPTPTPALDAEATVDPLLTEMAVTAAAALEACWNAGDWETVAAIVNPHFLQTALGIEASDASGRAAALRASDLGPLRIESVGPVSIWSDGRGAVDVVYFRGHGDPVQVVAARWFLTAERGVARFDEEMLLPAPALGDRITLGFGIADDRQPLRWSSLDGGRVAIAPVIALHGANRGREPHTFILQGIDRATLGVMTLPSWRQGDLILRDLPPGTYLLIDPAVDGSVLKLVVT